MSSATGWSSNLATTRVQTFDDGQTSSGDLPLGELGHQGGVLDGAHAVADPLGPQVVERGSDALGAVALAGVGDERSPAAIARSNAQA